MEQSQCFFSSYLQSHPLYHDLQSRSDQKKVRKTGREGGQLLSSCAAEKHYKHTVNYLNMHFVDGGREGERKEGKRTPTPNLM